VIEAGGVVSVIRLRGEDRRVVQRVHTQIDEVVQPVHDAVEVSAVELPAAPRVGGIQRVIPGCGDRPLRKRAVGCGIRSRETIGEDLVQHGVGHPRRRRVAGDEGEVLGVEDVDVAEPALVEDLYRCVAADEMEAVAVARVGDDDPRRPPLPPVPPSHSASTHAGSWSGLLRTTTRSTPP
jgi:hypothetical protein